MLSALEHVCVIDSTGVDTDYFSTGMVSLDLVGDIVYGLLVSKVLCWSTFCKLIA